MTIKAIETRYGGARFRSRTEARWAVFFDALNVRWDYEPEGFELSNGDWYLPDFWLPDQELWVEVKGGVPTSHEKRKCHLLADGTGHPVLLVRGTPNYEPGDWPGAWAAKANREDGIPAPSPGDPKFPYGISRYVSFLDFGDGRFQTTSASRGEEVSRAANMARAARFEHGECG